MSFYTKQIGVYIGAEYIEVAVLSKVFNKLKLKNIFRKNISVHDMEVSDQNEVIRSTLDDLFSSNNISRRNVFLTVNAGDITLRSFNMPRFPKAEWQNAIRFEGQKHVPFQLNEMISDFKVLNLDSEESEMNVLFLAARMTTVSRYISILNSLGIKCKEFTSVYVAMSRLVSFLGCVTEQEPVLVVSIKKKVFGRERVYYFANLVVHYKNCPYLARDITIFGNFQEIDEKFLNELYLSVKLFNSSLGSSQIEKVIMFAGKELRDWDEFFVENFSLTIENLDISEIFNVEAIDGITVGTSLGDLVLPDTGVNLVKSDFSDITTRLPVNPKILITVEIIIGICVFLSMFLIYQLKIDKLNIELNKLPVIPKQYNNLNLKALKNRKSNFKKRIVFLEKNMKSKYNLNEKIINITKLLKENSWINSFEFKRYLRNKSIVILQSNIVFFTNNIVKDMLLIDKLKADLIKNKSVMDGFISCVVKNIKLNNIEGKKYTSFSIELSSKALGIKKRKR
jgi:hypothetical protein